MASLARKAATLQGKLSLDGNRDGLLAPNLSGSLSMPRESEYKPSERFPHVGSFSDFSMNVSDDVADMMDTSEYPKESQLSHALSSAYSGYASSSLFESHSPLTRRHTEIPSMMSGDQDCSDETMSTPMRIPKRSQSLANDGGRLSQSTDTARSSVESEDRPPELEHATSCQLPRRSFYEIMSSPRQFHSEEEREQDLRYYDTREVVTLSIR